MGLKKLSPTLLTPIGGRCYNGVVELYFSEDSDEIFCCDIAVRPASF